jgi:nicotinamidase-related amidase
MSSASLQVPKSLEEIARPDRCALVVYDMQHGILSQLPHGPQILGKVLEVLEIAREHGFRIVFVRQSRCQRT